MIGLLLLGRISQKQIQTSIHSTIRWWEAVLAAKQSLTMLPSSLCLTATMRFLYWNAVFGCAKHKISYLSSFCLINPHNILSLLFRIYTVVFRKSAEMFFLRSTGFLSAILPCTLFLFSFCMKVNSLTRTLAITGDNCRYLVDNTDLPEYYMPCYWSYTLGKGGCFEWIGPAWWATAALFYLITNFQAPLYVRDRSGFYPEID